MSQSDDSVPPRYQPETVCWRQKDWLYERYWGALESVATIAADCDVTPQTIRRTLDKHGIPRRLNSAAKPETQQDLLVGFYRGTAAVPPSERSHSESAVWQGWSQ